MRKKVAILGGGMAGLAAAFELTRPGTGQDHDVTVYELGHRLGGKGASHRNPLAGDRIEEHGLHLWGGCYENAFRLIRECYEELGRGPNEPLATWEQAFSPQSLVVLEDHHRGAWHHWHQEFPRLPTRPGETDRIASPVEMFASLLRWMAGVCRRRSWSPPWSAYVHTIEGVADQLAEGTPLLSYRALGFVVDKLRDTARLFLRPFTGDPELRRMWLTLDFLASNVVGILDEGFLGAGRWLDNVAQIDHLGYREWLLRHGASEETTAAPMVRGLGDAVFNSNFRGAAGTALNGLVRLNTTYRGSLFYRMNAGMGETIFSPLYLVLKRRGVRFEFFHRVDRLVVHDDRLLQVELTRTQKPKDTEYRPLIDVGGLPCWRHEPDTSQIEPDDRRIVLDDFRAVVLAVPVGALSPITTELSDSSERWRSMLETSKTTRTQSMQIWFDQTLDELGWPHASPVTTGYAEALDTWADMTHLLEQENVPGAKNLAYFCGSLDDTGPDHEQTERVFAEGVTWLNQNLAHLLPGASWDRMLDPSHQSGPARLRAQYWKANTAPWERYTLSVPGSTAYRMTAEGSGFEHLFLAGDWTRTGMNVGSIEATAMSGIRAARAISGRSIAIPGDVD